MRQRISGKEKPINRSLLELHLIKATAQRGGGKKMNLLAASFLS
jgi:hypothetical protein